MDDWWNAVCLFIGLLTGIDFLNGVNVLLVRFWGCLEWIPIRAEAELYVQMAEMFLMHIRILLLLTTDRVIIDQLVLAFKHLLLLGRWIYLGRLYRLIEFVDRQLIYVLTRFEKFSVLLNYSIERGSHIFPDRAFGPLWGPFLFELFNSWRRSSASSRRARSISM